MSMLLLAVLSANVFDATRSDGTPFQTGNVLAAVKDPVTRKDTGKVANLRIKTDDVPRFVGIVGHLVECDGEIVQGKNSDGSLATRADGTPAWNVANATSVTYVGPQGVQLVGFPS